MAIELNASIFCALDILGTQSIANTFTFSTAIFFNFDVCCAGPKNDTSVLEPTRAAVSSGMSSDGAFIFRIMSADDQISFASSVIDAPDSIY